MGKNSRRKKNYKMVGCSKKTCKNMKYLGGNMKYLGGNMKYLGGNMKYLGGSADAPLAYTGQSSITIPNPYLAYTGKGGSNINAQNPAFPNTGPVSIGKTTIFNNSTSQKGGCGGMCSLNSNTQYGGGCGCSLFSGGNSKSGFMYGGSRHRIGCKCSQCKQKQQSKMKGGNNGMPYPDGLVGSSWTPGISGWPGVNGVPGDSNYYPVNTYKNDISRQMVDVGANPPFLNKGGGGKKRKQKGGTYSNFIAQDLINLGRQFQFGMGSAYNALAGYSSPVNPLPWKGQLSSSVNNVV